MFAATTSAAMVGVEPRAVRVEAHVGRPREGFCVVGLPDTAVREAKDRVRAALASSSYSFPARRITVNLAPADLPKAGSAYDLPIALGVLAAARLVSPEVTKVVALGELALDGTVRPAKGVLAAALIAARRGVPCLLPAAAAAEAAAVRRADIRLVRTLPEAIAAALGEWTPPASAPPSAPVEAIPDLADVRGQPVARRALEIAAAGGHHLLLVGPPGCGKTMLARRLPGILPDLEEAESLEVACVRSAAGIPPLDPSTRPFRSPHHSASVAAMIGGGSKSASPGEIALAHRGVLFLDELGEFPVNVLEALRQPLEEGRVTVSRRGWSLVFPARAQVVAATNPCPCGHRGDRAVACTCSESTVDRYLRRLSGPLLDRFDLRVTVGRPASLEGPPGEGSVVVKERVMGARARQRERGSLNSELDSTQLDRLPFQAGARALLAKALDRGMITGRGYDRIRRVARSIADLAAVEAVEESHVSEALALRSGL